MKIFTGKVIKKASEKTVAIVVERVVIHPVYKKRYKLSKIYQVHDEENKAKVGDTVQFVATKPYSKTKKWAIAAINPKKMKTKKLKPKAKKKETKKKS